MNKIRLSLLKIGQLNPAGIFALALIGVFCLLGIVLVVGVTDFQQFVERADALLHGQFYYRILPPSLFDTIAVGGRYYWPNGPIPAVLLVPLVALLGLVPLQSYLQPLLTVAVLYLTYRLAKAGKFSSDDSLWLAFAYCFASIYLGIAFLPYSGQFAHSISAVLTLGILLEFMTRRRPWLMGLLTALTLGTRVTAALVTLPILIEEVLDASRSWRDRVGRLVRFSIPVFVAILLLMFYNTARFGNALDSGYSQAFIRPVMNESARSQYGLFNPTLIPSNLYYALLSAPRPIVDSKTGHLVPPYLAANFTMGFFLLSPIFLLMFRASLKQRFIKLVMGSSILMTLVLLSYYAITYFEFGPRYLVDVLPLYYLLLLDGIVDRKLWVRDRIIIAISAFVNLYLFMSLIKIVWQLSPM